MNNFDFYLETKGLTDSGSFEGYASTFGNLDYAYDIIMPGAFKEGLAKAFEEKRNIPMLWHHDRSQPIGVWAEIAEDDKGLRVKGDLILEVQKGKEVHALLKKGAISGLSIGFRIPTNGATWDYDTDVRIISKAELREISLVSMPANNLAQVTSVKSILENGEFPTVRQIEKLFRDAGFSKSQAAGMAGAAARVTLGEPEAREHELLQQLKAFSL